MSYLEIIGLVVLIWALGVPVFVLLVRKAYKGKSERFPSETVRDLAAFLLVVFWPVAALLILIAAAWQVGKFIFKRLARLCLAFGSWIVGEHLDKGIDSSYTEGANSQGDTQ